MSDVAFQQREQWTETERASLQEILRLAIAEDLGSGDLTTLALVPEDATGAALVVARGVGVAAGLPAAEQACQAVDARIQWTPRVEDGTPVEPGQVLAEISGPARGLLSAERIALNLVGRLSGIASLTRCFVKAVAETKAKIYDTRKTIPGWRVLEKYAVRAGGGNNHRLGLFDAVLIKDNHLAFGAASSEKSFTLAEAVTAARAFAPENTVIEIEVDNLRQLLDVLPARPDVVLLDNMDASETSRAVELRDERQPSVQLESSGGVRSENGALSLALCGVDRVSVGALSHSAEFLDVGLDWK
ncbi:MAG: carboxylating nicotinate-nucleotide diphosphorylase [Planctomycetales bacterium]